MERFQLGAKLASPFTARRRRLRVETADKPDCDCAHPVADGEMEMSVVF